MTKLEKLQIAKSYYPNATIELDYQTPFQLVVAVMLSAQTTDVAVNKATEEMFKRCQTSFDFEQLTEKEIYNYIQKLGLAKSKTKHLQNLSHEISYLYNGEIPQTRDELVKLSGVGQKTANVVLANLYGQNYLAVDTHIERIAKRLSLTPQKASVKRVEADLISILRNENLNQYHHSLIFFGRYYCTAKKPNCQDCKLKDECYFYEKMAKKKIKENKK